MDTREIVTAERLAIYLTLPSAIAIAVHCFFPRGPRLPFWMHFTSWLVVVACLGALPTIWRSAFARPEKVMLTASHVVASCLVLPPLGRAVFWVIAGAIGAATR
jgi:hypothetical protein